MLDDFFIRAMLAGIGVALIAGPFGCFIVWRRLSYFGDTLSHGALLGVAFAFFFSFNIVLSVFIVSALIAMSLLWLQKQSNLSADALLGLLSHSSLALGLVVLALMGSRLDLQGLLFGDILAVSKIDILIIYSGAFFGLFILYYIWHALFAATVSHDLAEAEGLRPEFHQIIFTFLLAGLIAVAMKIVGILLITALLIIPAASARNLAQSPEKMAILAALLGGLSVIGGLFSSLNWDTPSGPSIVVVALIVFILSLLPFSYFRGKR